MPHKNRGRPGLSLIIMLLLLAGCQPSPVEKLLGKWQNPDGIRLEFFEDGTMRLIAPEGDSRPNVDGEWVILDDGRLKIDMDITAVGSTTTLFEIAFEDGELITTEESGRVDHYTRVE